MLFEAFYFVLSTLTATRSADSQVGNCKKGMCEMVGNTEICAEREAGNVLINGVCTAHNDGKVSLAGCKKKANDNVDASSVKCEQCDAANHFLYNSGCYSKDVAPGNEMCKTVTTNGICAEATDKKNLFAVPGATKTDQSVVWCGDVEGVTLGNSKKYTGVADYTTCEKPGQLPASGTKAATCSACKGSKLVKTVGDVTSCVEESDCNSGFFVNTNSGRKCTACADKNFDVCGAPETKKCSKCKTNGEKVYLKKENADPTGACVNAGDCTAGNTRFADDTIDPANSKTCKLCKNGGLTNCAKCEKQENGLVCKDCTAKFGLGKKSYVDDCPPNSEAGLDNICACAEGFEPNSDWSTCRPKSSCKTPDCQTCDNEGGENKVCTRCFFTHYLTPIKQCVRNCEKLGAYYTDSNNACQPCDPSCAACNGEGSEKCTACLPRKRLQYTDENSPSGGTCVDGCRPQSGAGGCETCGTTIGGTNYCSKCSMPEEVPINGVCKADNSRAPVCSKKDNQGGCATCASGYFRQDNGCYKTDRQPGIQICTLASQGDKCETCANSLPPSEAGLCPLCDSACKTCSSANDANTCSSCFVGYYQVGTRCVKCDTNDPNGNKPITGIKDCISCAPPDGGNGGSVLCYLMQSVGNTNKSGLTTGAIAGIAVVVVRGSSASSAGGSSAAARRKIDT